MSERSQLVAFWRCRLEANQEQYLYGSQRLRWLRRMYIRVYRFLLAQHGDAGPEEPSPPATVLTIDEATRLSIETPEFCEPPPSRMALVDNTPDHLGRPPKSPGRIQAFLKDIHNANDRLDKPGPLAKGLPEESWLVVASRRERWIPSKCMTMLRTHRIPSRLVQRDGDLAIEVARKDLEAASHLLQERREALTYKKRPLAVRTRCGLALVATLVGASLGLMIGCVGLFGMHAPLSPPVFLAYMTAGGAVIGFCNGVMMLTVRSRSSNSTVVRMVRRNTTNAAKKRSSQ